MRTNLKQPCNECPFRKNHPPGWLGPWESAGHVIVAAEWHTFPCHRTIKPEKSVDDMEVCAGASRFMANKLVMPRDPDMAAARNIVGKGDDVFETSQEMIEHHSQSLSEWLEKETTE